MYIIYSTFILLCAMSYIKHLSGSMDLSIYADNSDPGGSCTLYNSSSRILASKSVV